MRIIISYESGKPIYEQIKSQIRGDILRGTLKEGDMLPSIRTLAKELKIGIITAKRAYDDLCAEGFLYSVQAKGVYVAPLNKGQADSYALKEIRRRLEEVAAYARENSVEAENINCIIDEIFGENLNERSGN